MIQGRSAYRSIAQNATSMEWLRATLILALDELEKEEQLHNSSQSEIQEVVGQIEMILNEFWTTSDPLYRMDRILAAQKRLDSLTFSFEQPSF